MTEEVKRNYLEITSLNELKEGNKPTEDYSLDLIDPADFQLNKFFYSLLNQNYKKTHNSACIGPLWKPNILSG